MTRHIAIIGSGPAGYYSAEAAQKHWAKDDGEDVQVDIFDALPVPYGLIRSGVAPDHQSIKGVSRRYEKVALTDNVRFAGNVMVGRDITIPELGQLYDAVVLATGAPNDRELDIPGHDLGNSFGSAAFVGWYNGHPQFADLAPDLSGKHAAVIGMGNVALDVARILAKTETEFAESDIVAHALDALRASNIETIMRIIPCVLQLSHASSRNDESVRNRLQRLHTDVRNSRKSYRKSPQIVKHGPEMSYRAAMRHGLN